MITTEACKPLLEHEARYFSRGIDSRLAHQIAHRWFGERALRALSRDSWITESLAEHASGPAMAAGGKSKDTHVEDFEAMLADGKRETKLCEEARPRERRHGPAIHRDSNAILRAVVGPELHVP